MKIIYVNSMSKNIFKLKLSSLAVILSVFITLIISIWLSFAWQIKSENLKERELRDISTHMYYQDYYPAFTNVTANYQNDLSDLHFKLQENKFNQTSLFKTSTLMTLGDFFEFDRSNFNFFSLSENFHDFAWKKLFQAGTQEILNRNYFISPDLRVLKARNPLSITKNRIAHLNTSTFSQDSEKFVDITYFLIDSSKLKQECENCSLLNNLWYESEYMDSYNLNSKQNSYSILLPEITNDTQKSLVVVNSNRPILQDLFQKKSDKFKLSDWLKASSVDAYLPTNEFEIVIEIIPLEINEPQNELEETHINNHLQNNDDFFLNMNLKHWVNESTLDNYKLTFEDQTQYYVNKSGFDLMSFTKQYCAENNDFWRFQACSYLHNYSNKYNLNLNPDLSAYHAVNKYLENLQKRLKVFEYNGSTPVIMHRNDIYGLNLESPETRNYINFMSNKNIFDLQSDLDQLASSLIVDGPILSQNIKEILNNISVLGYNFKNFQNKTESLFKASGPISDLDILNSWSDWTMLGNQSLDTGTMIIVAWNDALSPWLETVSKPLKIAKNKFSYQLNLINSASIFNLDSYFNLTFQLNEKAGIGIRDDLQLFFEFENLNSSNFPRSYTFKNGIRKVKFKNLKFYETGEQILKVTNQFGETLLKYKFTVKENRDLSYRVYLIPFALHSDFRQSAMDDPTPYFNYPDNSQQEKLSNIISDSLDDNKFPDEDLPPEIICENQAEIFEAFAALRTDKWENYYMYENNYQDLLNEYADSFENYNCIVPNKKVRPTRIVYTGGGGGTGSGGVPPAPVIPVVNHVFPIQCYIGRRTYNTEILILENNTAADQTVTFKVEADNFGNPALEDNFTAGNADFWIFMSSIDSTGGAVTELPNPRDYGLLSQWHNTAIQIEVVAGVMMVANGNIGPFTLPAGEKRQISTVLDCGVDMLLGETGEVRVTVKTDG